MPAEQTRPKRALPPGAWDCHTHVFGPYARFPLAAERSYTPPKATTEDYLAMLDRAGLAHGVLVHPSAYGPDHAALYDALERTGTRLRGTGVATAETPESEFARMHRCGVQDPAFQGLLALVADGRVWVKMTPARNSKSFPDYTDVRPFHDALARANPDRLIWGSDWPYLRMGDATPDAGHLLDLLDAWCGDETLRRKILVDNPARLYGA